MSSDELVSFKTGVLIFYLSNFSPFSAKSTLA